MKQRRRRASKTTRLALRVVARLMKSEPLTAKDVAHEKDVHVEYPAIKRIFHEIEALIPGIVGSGRRNRRLRFLWPAEHAVDQWSYVALLLTRELTSLIHGSHLDVMLRTVMEDLRQRVTPSNPRLDELSRVFFAKSRAMNAYGIKPDTIDTVVSCILQGKVLKARYQHFGGTEHDMEIEPYSLIFGDEGLYLYGECVNCDDDKYVKRTRTFNLGRLRNAKRGTRPFIYPDGLVYPGRKAFEYCFGIFLPREGEEPARVVLRFHERWHAYLQAHRWHEHQSAPKRRKDGRLDVPLTLYITADLVRWVRGLGTDVEVIKPERLRRWVAEGCDPEHPETWG